MSIPDHSQTIENQLPLATRSRQRRGYRYRRRLFNIVFHILGLVSIGVGFAMVGILFVTIFNQGITRLNWDFLTSFDSRFPDRAGIKAALVGTLYTISLTIAIAFPLSVASAIYLEEYIRANWFSRAIEVNISNLAAVPSIIYGLLGLQMFIRWMSLGRGLLTGALTLALLVLPTIIIASREAIRAVPPSLREASYALGATRWQTTWHHVLPMALPGILTGVILAVSRAIGETAALITIGALTFVMFLPNHVLDTFTVLPILIFNWTSRPQDEFRSAASAAIIVLLALVLTVNAIAIILRQRLRRRL